MILFTLESQEILKKDGYNIIKDISAIAILLGEDRYNWNIIYNSMMWFKQSFLKNRLRGGQGQRKKL